jgi:Holliday junction resolvase RusA-like endonuclease
MHTVKIKPLSVNEAWQGRRFKTKKYKDFQKNMLLILPLINKEFHGKLKVFIEYGFSSKLSDIDNPCKMVLDCMCKKYGFDDRQIYELIQKKEIVKKGEEYIKFQICQHDGV